MNMNKLKTFLFSILFSIIRFFFLLELKICHFFFHTNFGTLLFTLLYIKGFFSHKLDPITLFCKYFSSYLISTVLLFYFFLNLESVQKIAFNFVSRSEVTHYIGNMFAKNAAVRVGVIIGTATVAESITTTIEVIKIQTLASIPLETAEKAIDSAAARGVSIDGAKFYHDAVETSNIVVKTADPQGLVSKSATVLDSLAKKVDD